MKIKLAILFVLLVIPLSICAQKNPREFYYPYRFGDKWGLADKNGEIILRPQFEEVLPFIGGSIFDKKYVVKQNGLYFVIFSDGKLLNDDKFLFVKPREFFISVMYADSTKGCLNSNYEPISCGGGYCGGALDGNAFQFYKKNGKYGVQAFSFDLGTGNHAHNFPAIWDNYYLPDESDYAVVESLGKKGLISNEGKLIIPVHYDEIKLRKYARRFTPLIVKYNGKYGVINKNNEVVIPFNYHSIQYVRGYYKVRKGDLLYYYTPNFVKLYSEK